MTIKGATPQPVRVFVSYEALAQLDPLTFETSPLLLNISIGFEHASKLRPAKSSIAII
jgi:hypothetical protein